MLCGGEMLKIAFCKDEEPELTACGLCTIIISEGGSEEVEELQTS